MTAPVRCAPSQASDTGSPATGAPAGSTPPQSPAILHAINHPNERESIMDLIARARLALREQQLWPLAGTQAKVAEAVFAAVEEGERTVVIVTGRPGTGKSATGIHLLATADERGLRTAMASGAPAFLETMRRIVCHGTSRLQQLFLALNRVAESHWPEGLDLLVCDGAQRLHHHSRRRQSVLDGEQRPQVRELIESATVTVFLLDEASAFDNRDRGTAAKIRAAATAIGNRVREIALAEGHREVDGPESPCLDWVEDLLWPRSLGPRPWTAMGTTRFDLAVADSPEKAEAYLADRAEEGSVRMLAGYCWRPSALRPNRPLPNDVRIGEWARPWPNPGKRGLPGAPAWRLWAAQGGFAQIGHALHTAEFEFDYTGVIIGPDLRWRNRAMITNPAANRAKWIGPVGGDRLIRAAYRTLLSRARLGTVIYATDRETRERLADLIQPAPR